MTSERLTEQQLLLFYYDDGLSDVEKQIIAKALQSDAVLAARYRELSASLDRLQDETPVSTPPHLLPQWHELVAREARLERQHQLPTKPQQHWLGWAAGLATMLVVGIAIGLWMQPAAVTQDAGDPALVEEVPDLQLPGEGAGAFTRAVQFYLDGQQAELAGMDDRQAETNQLILLQIIAQNRLIERAAEANQAPDLARLLRALEPVLLKLADPATSPEEAVALQRQLAFELQAMLTKLQQTPSKAATVI